MAREGGIHVDRAMPFLDQPVVESLMIALEVIVLGVFLHSARRDRPVIRRPATREVGAIAYSCTNAASTA